MHALFATMMGICFKFFFIDYSFATWKLKLNPKYPSPQLVESELRASMQGIWAPSLLFLGCLCFAVKSDVAYLDLRYGVAYELAFQGLFFLVTELCQWGFHRLQHTIPYLWERHKQHHRFYNPTPFAARE